MRFPKEAICIKFQSLFSRKIRKKNTKWRLLKTLPSMQYKKVREKSRECQSQAAAHPRHEEEEETDKSNQAQIEQTYEKH